MLLVLFGLVAHGQVNNPGGERIPYVKLRSDVWDVVIRKTADDRARIERVKASCNGIWVNACAPGVDPELRKIALSEVFKDNVKLSGDFTFCSTAVLRDIPLDMARGVIEPSTTSFCQVFLDPESVRSRRSGDATQGENALVSRLMGSSGTTSGQVRIKAPPTVNGSEPGREFVATGERRQPGVGVGAAQHQPGGVVPPQPDPSGSGSTGRVVAADTPRPEPSRPVAEEDEFAFLNEPDPGRMPRPAPEPARVASAPSPAPSGDLFGDDDDIFAPSGPIVRPEPTPAPAAAGGDDFDAELAALLAPIPTIESKAALVAPSSGRPPPPAPEPARPDPVFEPDPVFAPDPEPKGTIASSSGAPIQRAAVQDVAVPAPRPETPRPQPAAAPPPRPAPAPRGPSEFDLEAEEMAGMERLSDKGGEEDDKKKKKKDKDDEAPATVGGDMEFDNYIIIDIEGLDD